MKLFFKIFILNILLSTKSFKFCNNCKYYKPWIEWPADKTMGKCTYFPIVYKESYNLISGELIESSSDYEFCNKARNYEKLCGNSGKHYTPNLSDDLQTSTKLVVGGVNAPSAAGGYKVEDPIGPLTRPKNNDSSLKNLKTICDL